MAGTFFRFPNPSLRPYSPVGVPSAGSPPRRQGHFRKLRIHGAGGPQIALEQDHLPGRKRLGGKIRIPGQGVRHMPEDRRMAKTSHRQMGLEGLFFRRVAAAGQMVRKPPLQTAQGFQGACQPHPEDPRVPDSRKKRPPLRRPGSVRGPAPLPPWPAGFSQDPPDPCSPKNLRVR